MQEEKKALVAVRGDELVFFLVAMAAIAGLTLMFATWLAARSRRPPARKAPRKTFEHGRRLGRAAHAAGTDSALRALDRCPVGDIASLHAGDGRVDVVIARRRSQPCAQSAGYLAGLFESAWAHEVLVTHPECGGERAGTCHYVVQRAPIASGARAAGASTPGSEGAPRRSLRARPGGG